MDAHLAPEQVAFLQSVVSSGVYRNESEALADAVRLLERREALRSLLSEGEKELDAGLGLPANEVFARLEQRAALLDNTAGGSQA